jgi:hypothetical protein
VANANGKKARKTAKVNRHEARRQRRRAKQSTNKQEGK